MRSARYLAAVLRLDVNGIAGGIEADRRCTSPPCSRQRSPATDPGKTKRGLPSGQATSDQRATSVGALRLSLGTPRARTSVLSDLFGADGSNHAAERS